MGFEYKIICSITDEEAESILSSAPGYVGVDEYGLHVYRSPDNLDVDRMADARAKREPFGIYFVKSEWYGWGVCITGYIVQRCASKGPVTVDEY